MVNQIVADYNASQTKYKVEVQAFPQASYNDVGGRRGDGQEAALHPRHRRPERAQLGLGRLPGPADRPDGRSSASTCPAPSATTRTSSTRSATTTWRWRCSRASRRSTQHGIRIPTHRPAVDRRTSSTPRWRRSRPPASSSTRSTWAPATPASGGPTRYSPFLQSFGGDLINRDRLQDRRRRAQRRRGHGVGDLVPGPGHQGYIAAEVRARTRSPTSSTARSAMVWSGIWSAADTDEARRRRRLPAAAGLRQRPEDRRRVLAVGRSAPPATTRTRAMDYLKFSVATTSTSRSSPTTPDIVPATDEAAATGPGLRDRADPSDSSSTV